MAKAAANEVVAAAQQAMYAQPCTLAQIQAREADIRALAELTRALDKKVRVPGCFYVDEKRKKMYLRLGIP